MVDPADAHSLDRTCDPGEPARYYGLGVVLALVLTDNRAFCKCVCPVSVPMKAVGRLSLVKIDGDAGRCPEGCRTCIELCPMNIRVKDYLSAKKRVHWDHDPAKGNVNTIPNVAWVHETEEVGERDAATEEGERWHTS